MKHNFCAEYLNCRIRPVIQDDIEAFRLWRNNKALSQFLAPTRQITSEMQEKWFESNLLDRDIITFSIDETKELCRVVGSVSLYYFSNGVAEVGKTIIGDDEARGKSLAFYGEMMAMFIGFQALGIEKITTKTHENNASGMKLVNRLGFEKCGKHPFDGGGDEYDFIVTKEQFEKFHPFLQAVKIVG